jgi:hypothetical protein
MRARKASTSGSSGCAAASALARSAVQRVLIAEEVRRPEFRKALLLTLSIRVRVSVQAVTASAIDDKANAFSSAVRYRYKSYRY